MGYQGNGLALVSMTNKDVYYLTIDAAKTLKALIASHGQEPLTFFETVDAKSGSDISIAVANVSSIVIPRGGNRG